MTRTQTRTYGVVAPSSRQPLLEAMLRAFCWLVSNVASLFGTIINRTTRDWHTGAVEDDQLPTANDITQATLAAENTGVPRALIVSCTRSVRSSNHEGVLTSGSASKGDAFPAKAGIQPAREARSSQAQLSPLITTNVGNQKRSRHAHKFEAASQNKVCRQPWIPTFVGKSGDPSLT